MSSTHLSAARVVTPDGVVAPGAVEIEAGLITAVHAGATDPADLTLAPGFVDLQVNGIGAIDVASATGADWDQLDQELVAHGVTAWCPTLITQPLDRYAAPLARIADAAGRTGPRPAILGAHLEGPFLGGAPGAHPRQYLQPIDAEWLRALPPIVRLVTLSPELDGAYAAIRDLSRRGVLVSLGHSTAAYHEASTAAAAGARLVTHCFNGMGPFNHRAPGLVGAALTHDALSISLIADLVHVHPGALRLAFRAKGPDRVVLVTDAVGWEAGRVGERAIAIDAGAPRLADGTLAGSCLSMDAAVANVVLDVGIDVETAVRAASTNPANLMRAPDRGRIAVGARADLVALDPDLRVAATWIAGEQVYARVTDLSR